MFQNMATTRSSTTNRGNNFFRITERRISGETLGFECVLHPNLIFVVFFFGTTSEKFMYFDPNSKCNGDKTTRTVITSLLTLCYHVLNIKLPFFRVLSCFLRRHLLRLSSFESLSLRTWSHVRGYQDTCQTCLRHKMRWKSLDWLLAKLSTTFCIGATKYQVFLGPPTSPEPLFSSFWLNSDLCFAHFGRLISQKLKMQIICNFSRF